MKVLGIRWVGVRADGYAEMVGFLRDVLGLQVAFEDDATAELSLANDDRVQVFGPGHRYYELFGAGGGGPVPLFEVDDLQAAHAELVAAGIEVIGEIERDASWEWLTFRGPAAISSSSPAALSAPDSKARTPAASISQCGVSFRSPTVRIVASRVGTDHNGSPYASYPDFGGAKVARRVLNRAAAAVAEGDASAPQSALAADIIIENAPDPVFVADLDGKILQANEAVSQLLGFRQDEVVEQSLSQFISAEETREFTAALREVVERGVTRDAVLNPRSASGEVIPTSLNASALRDSEGNVIGAIGILRDMRELDKARAYAQRLIEDAPDPVFVSDLEGKILEANEAVSELLGFRRDEVVEQSLSRFISEEETREFTAALREVVERGVTRNARLNPRAATGEVIPTSLNASALRDTDGKVIGAIGVLRDMRELDKARAYAESLIRNAPDPVFVSDLEGKILEANDAVSDLLGFRRDEVVEQSLSRFISEEETREFTAALREVVERGVTRNARLNPRAATGEVIPTSLNASALRDPDGKVIGAIGVLRDMRAYEQVVNDLEQSKTELQEKILDLEKFEEVVVGRELKMIALEKELEGLQQEVSKLKAERAAD
jgi:PAS domain S-box-containing protein